MMNHFAKYGQMECYPLVTVQVSTLRNVYLFEFDFGWGFGAFEIVFNFGAKVFHQNNPHWARLAVNRGVVSPF